MTTLSDQYPPTCLPALADALEILGFAPIYHMCEMGKNNHQGHWIAALEAKFAGKGPPFGREEFDSFLGSYAVRVA